MNTIFSTLLDISTSNERLSIITKGPIRTLGLAKQIREPFELVQNGTIHPGKSGNYIVQPEAGEKELVVMTEDDFNAVYDVYAKFYLDIDSAKIPPIVNVGDVIDHDHLDEADNDDRFGYSPRGSLR